MITRRLFAKALASLALIPTLIAPGRAAKPNPTRESKLLLFSRGGTMLAEIDVVIEDVGGSHAVRGDGEIIASGIATRYAWRLPNGETPSGDVEDLANFNTHRLVAGGRVAIAGDGGPMARPPNEETPNNNEIIISY